MKNLMRTCYTDRLSHKLLPIDSKIMEQTKQIKAIFGLLEKKQDDNSLSLLKSKNGKIKSIYIFLKLRYLFIYLVPSDDKFQILEGILQNHLCQRQHHQHL